VERGAISPNTHGMIEPIAAIVIILSSWIFSFSATDDAQTISIVIGILMLVVGSLTCWRPSFARVIPLKTHFMLDLGVAAVLILAPSVFGFSGAGGATRFFVIAGVLELATALATRWDAREVDTATNTAPRTTSPAR
jgi:hypothetical protein